MNETTDWWAWDGENFHHLGSHEDIEDAFAADDKREGNSSLWVFSRKSLEDMRQKLGYTLGVQRARTA